MTYRIENGRYEAILPNGETISFDDVNEMIACAKMREELFNLVGRPIKNMDKINELLGVSQPVRQLKSKKKKVRFTIDSETEHIGMQDSEHNIKEALA